VNDPADPASTADPADPASAATPPWEPAPEPVTEPMWAVEGEATPPE